MNLHIIRSIEQQLNDYSRETDRLCTSPAWEYKRLTRLYFKRLFSPANPAYRLLNAERVQSMPPLLLSKLLRRYGETIPAAALTPLIIAHNDINPLVRAICYIGKHQLLSSQRTTARIGYGCQLISANGFRDFEKEYGKGAYDILFNKSFSQVTRAINEDDFPSFCMSINLLGAHIPSSGLFKYLFDEHHYALLYQILSDRRLRSAIANAGFLRHCILSHASETSKITLLSRINECIPGLVSHSRYAGNNDLLWLVCEQSLATHPTNETPYYPFNETLYNHLVSLNCYPFRRNALGLSAADFRNAYGYWTAK